MVGNAHIDPMWIWDWDEGMHEVLQTFRAAADRLDEDPELRFTASSASYYRWVLDTSPELFARIRRHVAPGAGWSPVDNGSSPTATSLPASRCAGSSSTASASWRTTWGSRPPWATTSTPSATRGPSPNSSPRQGSAPTSSCARGRGRRRSPHPPFAGAAPTAPSCPAYRIPYEYSTEGAEEMLIRGRADELVARSSALGIPLMAFFGVGDHGGGPTRLAMRTVHALSAESGGAVAFGDPTTYFEALGDEARRGSRWWTGSSSGMPSAATRPGPTSSWPTGGPRTHSSRPRSSTRCAAC